MNTKIDTKFLYFPLRWWWLLALQWLTTVLFLYESVLYVYVLSVSQRMLLETELCQNLCFNLNVLCDMLYLWYHYTWIISIGLILARQLHCMCMTQPTFVYIFFFRNNQGCTTSLDPQALKHLAAIWLIRLSKPANTGVFPLQGNVNALLTLKTAVLA